MKKLSQEQAISDLVDHDISTIIEGNIVGDNSYINDIMSSGFIGYFNFSEVELITEYKETLGLDIMLIDEVDEDTLVITLEPVITKEMFEKAKDILIKTEEAIIEKREVALDWWNRLNPTAKQMHIACKYVGRGINTLTG